jgi:ATP-binding cassette subfamily F protein 3
MIDFTNVSKRYGTQVVLQDASFRVNTGEQAGLVGPNGTGKSTIAGIIAGDISPDAGEVTLPNDIEIGILRQQLATEHLPMPLLSFAETGSISLQKTEKQIHEIERQMGYATGDKRDGLLEKLGELQTQFEHAGGYEQRHRTEAALDGLGFTVKDFQRSMKEFSGGWQMRAALARTLVANPGILLLDEPSNYLDLPAVEWLQHFLKSYTGTLLLISHDRYLLNSLTSITIEVANGITERYTGNYDRYVRDRVARVEAREAAQKNMAKKLEKAEQFVNRFRYQATKASQVKSREKMIARMETVDVPQAVRSRGTIRIPTPPRSGQEIVRLEDAGFSYDGDRWILQDLNLSISRGEKIALVGHNGLGKTTLLRLLAGILSPGKGKHIVGHNVVMGYQSQEFTDTMNPTHSVLETVKQVADSSMREQTLRGLLGGFGFSGDAIEKRVSVLSGGEKVRLAFARLLVHPPNFLLLDEPTTHLDITARETLEDALRQYEGTLCIVSHDTTFVERVATSIIAMRPPGIRPFPGTYSEYRDKIANETQMTETVAKVTEKIDAPLNQKELRRQRAAERQEKQKETRQLKRQLGQIEKQIAIFEEEQAKILTELAKASPQTDFESTNRRLQLIQRELSAYTKRWEETAETLEGIEPEN